MKDRRVRGREICVKILCPDGSELCGASKKGKGRRQMGEERPRRDSETDRVCAQTENLISFPVCQGITGELTDLRV